MAACSEQQIDGTVGTDLRSNFPVPAANIQNSEVRAKASITSERSSSQKVANSGVEELNFLSLPEEELECLLKELTSHGPKREASLRVQHLLEGACDADQAVPPHGEPPPQPPGGKARPRKRSSIPAHRSLQDLPALQDGAQGCPCPTGGGAVRAHSLSDRQEDLAGDCIEMHSLAKKGAEESDRLTRNGLLASEEEKEEDGKGRGLLLAKLVGEGTDREMPKAFCSNSISTGGTLPPQFGYWRSGIANRCHDLQGGNNNGIPLRKGKKARTNAAAETVLAKNIVENNCGHLPIECLLEYICSGDKRPKSPHNNNNNVGAKLKIPPARKPASKGGTTTPQEEEDAEDLANNNFVEGRLSPVQRDKRGAAPSEETPALPCGGTPERSLSPSFYSDQGVDGDGGYRVDVSSFSDHEECEFRVVTKKHRRKLQAKMTAEDFRRTPYRPATFERKAATERSSEATRRKSAGSAPHSEQSSPENSDLDSVHSLPVAAASAPQTSYADIARMSCARQARDFPPRSDPPTVAADSPTREPVPSPSDGPVGESPAAAKRRTCRSECPPVVIMDGDEESAASLGDITFGFDVNERLLCMTLSDAMASGADRPAPLAAGEAPASAVPRFEGCTDDVGRFNYGDVVDFLDRAWSKAYQSYEKDAGGEKREDCLRILYYGDSAGERS